MQVQRGRSELVPARSMTEDELMFEFPISVDISDLRPNFLGPFSQGPKDARFIYVNSGTYAGQHSSWSRRAKLSLMSVTREQIEQIISSGGTLETSFPGVGRDGGPTCASVKGLEWKIVRK